MVISRSIEEIKNIIENHKKELKERYGVKEIGVFGSYVRSEQKETSDIDILVDFYPHANMDLIKFVELECFLSELLGINVDLVMKTALKPRIGSYILKEVVYV